MATLAVMDTGATFDEARTHRYTLWRRWGDGPAVNIIGLNPSTAAETEDDPTIRRCIRFARDWGYAGLVMTNIFAWRATNPRDLPYFAVVQTGGKTADKALVREATVAGLVVAAWGALPQYHQWRVKQVRDMMATAGVSLHAIRTTQGGHPAHPLYLPARLRPIPYGPQS